MQLRSRRVQHHVSIETCLQSGGIAGIEGRITVGHAFFHLVILAAHVHRPGIEQANVAAQVNGKAEFLDQISAQNPFNRMAACGADPAQVNGGNANISYGATAHCQFSNEYLRSIQRSCACPRGHADGMGIHRAK